VCRRCDRRGGKRDGVGFGFVDERRVTDDERNVDDERSVDDERGDDRGEHVDERRDAGRVDRRHGRRRFDR
jgi:hypothetical protein